MDVNAASQLRHLTSLTKLSIRPEAVETSATQLSFSQIRTLRQSFEQETQALQHQLGHEQHQTMLVAMYEGTEQLLHKPVSDFAVIEYLESLKLSAQDLHKRGMSGEEFRTQLLEQSRNSLSGVLRHI